MPRITSHQSSHTTKLLLIGDSGTGKTGALASLAAAGYKLRILDLDNGLDIVKNYATDPNSPYVKQNPKIAENISYQTFTDTSSNVNGRLIYRKATVWQNTIKALDSWKDEDDDFGPLTSWTEKDVLVIDSLSMLSNAALNFHLAMNAALGSVRTQNEGRRDIGVTQNLIRDLLSKLYDDAVKCNVIVISHITMVSDVGAAPKVENGELQGSLTMGYPSAIGRALSPHIPRYFNSMLVARTIGAGSGTRHKLCTTSQMVGGQTILAKTSAPLKVKPEYDLSTGLAEYFAAVRS